MFVKTLKSGSPRQKNKIAHILSERDPLPVGNWFIIPSWLPGALCCKNEWMEGTDGWVIPSSIRLTTTTLDTSRVLQKYIFLRRQKPNLSHVQSCWEISNINF